MEQVTILRTAAENPDFIALVKLLDADLAIRDGEDHAFYNQFNKIDQIKYAIVVYRAGQAVACGAIKEYAPNTVEIKRMYTAPAHRGKGLASRILKELEQWAAELSYEKCILETGINQPEAIALYKKTGYTVTSNYGQYVGVATSVCFAKQLEKVADSQNNSSNR